MFSIFFFSGFVKMFGFEPWFKTIPLSTKILNCKFGKCTAKPICHWLDIHHKQNRTQGRHTSQFFMKCKDFDLELSHNGINRKNFHKAPKRFSFIADSHLIFHFSVFVSMVWTRPAPSVLKSSMMASMLGITSACFPVLWEVTLEHSAEDACEYKGNSSQTQGRNCIFWRATQMISSDVFQVSPNVFQVMSIWASESKLQSYLECLWLKSCGSPQNTNHISTVFVTKEQSQSVERILQKRNRIKIVTKGCPSTPSSECVAKERNSNAESSSWKADWPQTVRWKPHKPAAHEHTAAPDQSRTRALVAPVPRSLNPRVCIWGRLCPHWCPPPDVSAHTGHSAGELWRRKCPTAAGKFAANNKQMMFQTSHATHTDAPCWTYR